MEEVVIWDLGGQLYEGGSRLYLGCREEAVIWDLGCKEEAVFRIQAVSCMREAVRLYLGCKEEAVIWDLGCLALLVFVVYWCLTFEVK